MSNAVTKPVPANVGFAAYNLHIQQGEFITVMGPSGRASHPY